MPSYASSGLPPLPPDLDPRGRHRHSGGARRGHGLLLAGRLLAALLSVTLLITFGTYWWKYHAFSAGLNRLNVFGASASKPSSDIDGKAQNLLIVGNDDRQTATDAELAKLGTGRDGGSLNTDTMMIVHVPSDGTKATLISLPRDSYVDIPGVGMNKLNDAYPAGYAAAGGSLEAKRSAGAKLLIQVVETLTGLTVDHFVSVDLLGFYRISEAIGPITVNMCQAVKEPDSGINLHQGINHIQGTQALAFVRQRYDFPNGLGDLDRVERQRYFLTAAFRQLTSAGVLLNPVRLQSLLSAISSSLYMDSTLDPLSLARQMENLSANNIAGQTIPTNGFNDNTPVGSVVVVDPSAVKAFVNKLVGSGDSKLAAAKPVSPSTVTVDVDNAGSGVNQAATKSAAVLQQIGFRIGTVTDAPSSSSTTIEYADGMQAEAKTVAAYVPGATLLETSSVQRVTVLLGADGLAAKAPAATTSPSSTAPAPTTSGTPAPKPLDAGCIN